jgi:hypothetical protein
MALDKDDIKALIAILQKGLVDQDESDNDIEEPVHIKPAKKKTSVPTTKPKKKKAINKFDKMAEFSMCKEDTEIDKKIKKPPPSIRNRRFDFIKVQCRVCGKKEKVAPMLVESTERYKCNRCSTGAG